MPSVLQTQFTYTKMQAQNMEAQTQRDEEGLSSKGHNKNGSSNRRET